MNRGRLEALSDGIFAIVFTLLVLELRVPEALMHPSSAELWHAIFELTPVFVGFVVSFAVLTMFWVSHTFFFGDIVKEVNRQLVGLNMVYLMFISLIPFSAYLIGRYSEVESAVLIYGINVLLIGILAVLRFEYAMASREIDTSHNERRHIAQARVRMYITPGITLLGMFVSFVSIPVALFLYAFPVIFNIIPGFLNKIERVFGFRLGE
jgi:uncharacterized membrane protein